MLDRFRNITCVIAISSSVLGLVSGLLLIWGESTELRIKLLFTFLALFLASGSTFSVLHTLTNRK